MKRLVIALVLAFGLSGCVTLDAAVTATKIATTSITNPVTRTDLYKLESGIDFALVGLVAYRRACLQGAAGVNCRDNIRKMQVYTRQAPPLLAQLRSFVKNNDQINARIVYDNLTQLYTTIKTLAATAGINIGVLV